MKTARRIAAAASWLCAAAVVLYWVALRFVGERWWMSTVALYLPQAVLLLPLGALALLLAAMGLRRHLALQAAAACVVLFPIMGLTASFSPTPTPGAPRLRVLSFNVDSGKDSVPDMVAEIQGAAPDVVLLQESAPAVNAAVAAALPDYQTWTSTQFFVVSRYPIVDHLEPRKIPAEGHDRSPRFVRATLGTPLGPLDVYDVHPISPREALESIRGEGVLAGLESGAIFAGDHRVVTRNAALRRLQVQLIAELAAASSNPVLIAGDTNLPHPSQLVADVLGRWQDGFAAVGNGLGLTFPVSRRGPWMRIDRILAGPSIRFLGFGVGRGAGSDHRCVWADVELAPR